MKKSEEKIIKLIKENLNKGNKEIKIHTIGTTGSGRYSKYTTDKSPRIIEILEKYNIKYFKSNDAPKGGKLGDYISFNIDKRNKLVKKIIKEEKEKEEEEKKNIENKLKNIQDVRDNIEISDFTSDEIFDFLKNYVESEKMYIYRKRKGLTFREFRKIMKEVTE